jgi:hypothetical protein
MSLTKYGQAAAVDLLPWDHGQKIDNEQQVNVAPLG